jgi:phosphopantothenoylcysteine decarboxylase/phosphopantothenate--cysteine ligase
VLGVSGSVAAFKAAVVARLLVKDGAAVRTILTRSAARFVGEATFSGLTGNPVSSDMFADSAAGELHVSLAEQSDAIVLVPATADLIARIASGRADDLLTATILCASCPILAAPTMHPTMWAHPATQRNVTTIEADGRVDFVGPVEGEVASGDHGQGRMAEPEDLVDALVARLTTRDLLGRHIVVTAGPTVEDLDPVRFVSNRSSGKMGFALARRAAARGARVTLIAGPVTLTTPYGVQRVDVRSAIAMRGAIWQALGPDLSNADALLMAAAVGDYRPAETRAAKLKRGDQPLALELVQNPDLLAEIGDSREGTRPVLVGFAVETGSDPAIVEYATDKLHKKRVDLVVANHAEESLGRDDNRVTLVSREGAEPSDAAPKGEVADRILDWVVSRVATGE